MNLLDIVRRSGSGRCRSPRPARRRRPVGRRSRRPAASRRAGAPTTSRVWPASRSAWVSPTQTIATSPARQAASALARTTASVSPWSARRSEWPTMMALAPASASISAEISPVWAPDALAWQSCAPIAKPREPRAELLAEQRAAASPAGRPAGRPCRPAPARRPASPRIRRARPEAVHLPVSGDQRTDGVGHVGSRCLVRVMGALALAERAPRCSRALRLTRMLAVASSGRCAHCGRGLRHGCDRQTATL